MSERMFAVFPALEEQLRPLIDDDEGPLVYSAMTLLAEHLIAGWRTRDTDRFPALFAIVEEVLKVGTYDVRNMVISGLLEDLSNFAMHAQIPLAEWEALLQPETLRGWNAVLDLWSAKIKPAEYNAILEPLP